jgi:hypothetical protein
MRDILSRELKRAELFEQALRKIEGKRPATWHEKEEAA